MAGCAVLCIAAYGFAEEPKSPAAKPAQDKAAEKDSKCPVLAGAAAAQRHTAAGALSNRDWWPNQLNLQILRQNTPKSNPLGEHFNYAEEFKKLDLEAVKKDINALLTTSSFLNSSA